MKISFIDLSLYTVICTGGCGVNKECTGPENCTCVQGWTGQDCLTGTANCSTISASGMLTYAWLHTNCAIHQTK